MAMAALDSFPCVGANLTAVNAGYSLFRKCRVLKYAHSMIFAVIAAQRPRIHRGRYITLLLC